MSDEGQAYNVEAIRELLATAFTAEELQQFCQARPLFEHVVNRFEPGQSLDSMVDEVVAYAQRWDLLAELLSGAADARPRQFGRRLASIFRLGETRTGTATALLTLAQTFLEKEAYAEAIPLLRQVREADPGNMRAKRLLVDALYHEGAHLHEQYHDLRGARAALHEVVAMDPSHDKAAQLLYAVEHELDVRASVERVRRRGLPGWVWLVAALGVLIAAALVLLVGSGLPGGGSRLAATATVAVATADTQIAVVEPPPTAPPPATDTATPQAAVPSPSPSPTWTRGPTDTHTPEPTVTQAPTEPTEPTSPPTATPSATASPPPSDTPEPSPSPTPRPSPTRRPPPTPTRPPTGPWSWRGFGPFAAASGAMGFVNYTDEVLTFRLFDFATGETHVYDVSARAGSTLAIELRPGNYAIHAWTPTTPGIYVAVLPTWDREEQWHCEILDSLRVYKRRVLVLAFAIKRGTTQNPEERRLDLDGCPWLEKETTP